MTLTLNYCEGTTIDQMEQAVDSQRQALPPTADGVDHWYLKWEDFGVVLDAYASGTIRVWAFPEDHTRSLSEFETRVQKHTGLQATYID